ncbi:HD domain-containing protein [Kribbella sp. NPDC048915]|uniref:HD domain-containing protein n=1 Tax=Kribbella sp. NPDC048915 TaxID=3155148 RepID=UPI0033CBD244
MMQTVTHAPIGTIGWTERTGGVLSAGERLSLAPALLRNLGSLVAGRAAMATRMHAGRRNTVAPDALAPPNSPLAREAEAAVQDLLTPALLNHSRRAYAWGAALAALDDIEYDRELLYLAALFHDTGLPSQVPSVDFTVRSAELARDFSDRHQVPAVQRELVTNAIALHHTPGVTLDFGPEAFLLSAGAAVDVFGLRSDQLPDGVRRTVVQDYPRTDFKREFSALLRTEAHQVPHGRAWYLHHYALSTLTIRLAPFHG